MKHIHVLGRRLTRLLTSTRGAFDLTSVLVGAAVVAILVGGTAVTTYGVIPWAQDNGARQNLSAVSTAQGVAKVRDGKFMDTPGLTGASYLSAGPSLAVGADTNGACWVGLSKSDTGKVFYSTNDKTDPQPFASGTNTGCVAKTALRQMAVAVGAPLPVAKLAGWGAPSYGSLGTGTAANLPGDVAGALAGKHVTSVSAGDMHTCAIADGAAYCWGANFYGQLGNGTKTATGGPVLVTGILAGKNVTDISAGPRSTCAIADGKGYCWGLNDTGQLGTGDTAERLEPATINVSGILAGKTVTSISAAYAYGCAVADGKAYCWGKNDNATLGTGNSVASTIPVAVDASGPLAGKTVSTISAEGVHACALAEGAVYCWGWNNGGVLGSIGNAMAYSPRAVDTSGVLAGKTVTLLETGPNHNCVIAGGALFCWGWGDSGRLGTGSTDTAPTPVAVTGILAGKTITSVATGSGHSCAVADAKTYCWGKNDVGQLGTGDTTPSLIPVAVSTTTSLSGKDLVAVATGTSHTMGIYE